jgi:hypothetical protein
MVLLKPFQEVMSEMIGSGHVERDNSFLTAAREKYLKADNGQPIDVFQLFTTIWRVSMIVSLT